MVFITFCIFTVSQSHEKLEGEGETGLSGGLHGDTLNSQKRKLKFFNKGFLREKGIFSLSTQN